MSRKQEKIITDFKYLFKQKSHLKVVIGEILLSLLIYLLIFFGIDLLLKNEKTTIENQTVQVLNNSINTIYDVINYKLLPTRFQELSILNKDERFYSSLIKLIEYKKKKEKLVNKNEFLQIDRIVKRLQPLSGYLEFSLLSKDYIVIYSNNKSTIGQKSSLYKRFPFLLKRAFDGEANHSPIIPLDKKFNKEIGYPPDKPYPTMFLFIPVNDENNNTVAVISIRISPINELNFLLQTAYFGKTGEVYLISDSGLLLTQVRNEDILRKLGYLKSDEFSCCNLYLKLPKGKSNEIEEKEIVNNRKNVFTFSAEGIIKHKSGFNKNYINYLGNNVLGVWRWDPTLKAGFCAEISRDEVLSSYNKFKLFIYLLYTFMVLATFLFGLLLLKRRKQEQKEIVERESFFGEVLNRASSGIVTLEGNGKILTFNMKAEEIFGYKSEEVIGKEFKMLFIQECREKFENLDFQEAIQNYSKEKQLVMGVKKNGKYFPLKLVITKNVLNEKEIYIAILEDVTEITEAKAALEKSVKLYQKTYSNAPIGIANIDKIGKFLSANDYLLKKIGYSKDELLKLTVFDIFGSEKTETLKNFFYPIFRGEKEQSEIKLNVLLKSGKEILFSVTCSKIFDEPEETEEFVLLFEDITAQQRFEDELRKKAKELEEKNRTLEKARMAALNIMQDANIQKEKAEKALAELEKSSFELKKITSAIEQAGVSVVITNRNAKIEYVNPFFTKLTGYSREEVLGKSPNVLKSGHHDKEFYKNMWDTILSKKVWKGEILNKKKNGELYWEYITITPLENSEGKITHFIGVKEDITEKKKQDLELKRAKLAAEAATEAKSRFLASMSHEIRTPMNAILGLTHLALESNPPAKIQNYLSKIESSSELLLKIINDILDFSKIEAGELSIEMTEFDLNKILHSTLTIIAPKAYEKGLEVILDMPQNIPTQLIGDPLRLGQILTNFANNAVKFTEKGEIVISIKIINETDTNVELLFAVEDTGIGIKEENKSKLFTPFQQEDVSTTRKYGGTGLGLVISKRLAELMGGKTWFESTYKVGSTFYVQIPFEKQSVFSVSKIHIRSLTENKTVLLCERNYKVRHNTGKILHSFGLKVFSAESCKEFLKNPNKNTSNRFDAAIIDFSNIVEKGENLLPLIKEKVSDKIIITSSLPDMPRIEQMKLDFYDFKVLIKPVLSSELYNSLISFWSDKLKINYANFQEKEKSPENINLSGVKILLAEDNEINQEVARELLSSIGIEIDIANNGKEAVEKVAQSGSPSKYSLVLMDIQMPEMDGFTATREIRKMKEYKDLPIIAMTADAMQGVKEQCYAAGMVDYLTKPIERDKLFASLVKWTKISEDQLKQNTEDESKKETPERSSDSLIDFSEASRLVGGNEKLLNDLLEKFVEKYSDFNVKIQELCLTDNKEEALRLVHTLKGNAGTLGMKDLFNVTVRVHSKLLRNEDIDFDETFSELFAELKKVLDFLSKKDVKNSEEKESVDAKDISEVKEKLEKLAVLLDDYDSDAVNLAKDIGVIKNYEEESKQLLTLIKNYKFDEAIEILNKIINDK